MKVVWLSTLHAPVTEARCENDPSLLKDVKNSHGLKCKRWEHSRQLIGGNSEERQFEKKKKQQLVKINAKTADRAVLFSSVCARSYRHTQIYYVRLNSLWLCQFLAILSSAKPFCQDIPVCRISDLHFWSVDMSVYSQIFRYLKNFLCIVRYMMKK